MVYSAEDKRSVDVPYAKLQAFEKASKGYHGSTIKGGGDWGVRCTSQIKPGQAVLE